MATGGTTLMPKSPGKCLDSLHILLLDGGLLVLRAILDQTLAAIGISLDVCLSSEKSTILRLKSRGIITQAQYNTLFPSGGKVPTLTDLDTTLIIILLRNITCFGMHESFDWNTTPNSNDVSFEADIWRLQNYRTHLCNIPTTTEMEQNDFISLWNDIEQILLRLSPPPLNIQQVIADLKTVQLDAEEKARIQKEIHTWEDYEAKEGRLQVHINYRKRHLDLKRELNEQKRLKDASVIDKTFRKLKVWMIPDVIIDADNGNKLFDDFAVKRDIQEQKTTTEKNDLILKIVRRKGKNSYRDFKELLNRTRQEKLVDFLTRTENGLETGNIENELYELAENRSNLSPNYFKLRKDLKDDLIKSYRQRHSKVPLSPLFEEKDTPFDSFYIRPEIQEKTPGTKDEMHQVKSLSDMFKHGRNISREIYLTADAGLGKTTFSKYLAISWCQAHCPEETYRKTCLEKDDIDCMRGFEFVFLVLLRDTDGLCSIDDLIYELTASTLAHSEKFDKGFLQEIQSREKCLVILDGLDEWTHPEHPRKPCHRAQRSIPHRNDREMCVVLTTTRPWKLGMLTLNNSDELGKNIVLSKLSKDAAATLTKRTIQRLKFLPDEGPLNTETNNFNKEINARGNADLVFVPLLLMYIICLWCDGDEIGNSKCELYVNIVELLLSRMTKKHGELQSSRDPFTTDIPEYLNGHYHCIKYFKLLMALGELAYQTLFDKTKELSLVFNRSLAEQYLKPEDLKISLLSGILTESTTRANLKQMSKVSFSHKTVHEFFAAIYFSSQSDGQENVAGKCKSVQSILDMSTVCQFISGMNATMMCEISVGFLPVIEKDKETRSYRTRTTDKDIYIFQSPLYYIQGMLLSCLKEIPESENTQICLPDLFISDDQSDQDLKCLSKLNKNNIKSVNIRIHENSLSFYEIFKLSSLTTPEYPKYLQKLCYEYIGDEPKKEAEINCFFSPCLESLSLKSKLMKQEENLNEEIEQIQNLQYLYITDLNFSHEKLEIFLNCISSKRTLKKVRLSKLYCNEHHGDCERRKFDLSKHSQLTTVVLTSLPPLQLNITTSSLVKVGLIGINFEENSLLISPEMRKIKHVTLSDMEISVKSLQNYVKVLEQIPHPVRVGIDDCHVKPEEERQCFKDDILSSENFDVTYNLYNHENGTWSFEFNTRKQSKDL